MNGAGAADTAVVLIEIGAVALALAVLARLAGKLGITAIPFYLIAGLAVGQGGFAPLDVSAHFIRVVAEIGVLLLLTLGLEYTAQELHAGLRKSFVPGVADAALNFAPGFAAGLIFGWGLTAAVLLGGICWVSSSGIVAKLLRDMRRLSAPETPAILDLLVVEDLAMAIYLPIVGALVAGGAVVRTTTTVVVAVSVVVIILFIAMRFGRRVSVLVATPSDEALLLTVFGATLLVAGLAQQFEVSGAIAAFLVGLALSGPVRERAGALVGPLRDISAAVFFLFFSFQIRPLDVLRELAPAALLAAVGMAAKFGVGWYAAQKRRLDQAARIRAGATLIPRGEFSIIVASFGAGLVDGARLRALAAAFVLITAVAGPLIVRFTRPVAQATPREAPS